MRPTEEMSIWVILIHTINNGTYILGNMGFTTEEKADNYFDLIGLASDEHDAEIIKLRIM